MKIVIKESQYKFLVEQTTPPTTTPPTTKPKPMFGTPEERAAAKSKREGQRKINFDRFVKGAFYKNFFQKISDGEYNSGCQMNPNPEMDYLDGTSMELPEFVYREQQDGSKIKINLRKYQKLLKKESKQDDAGLDGLQDPNFKPTKCGISRQHAKDDKEAFKKL